jgi:hypothetical protein
MQFGGVERLATGNGARREKRSEVAVRGRCEQDVGAESRRKRDESCRDDQADP